MIKDTLKELISVSRPIEAENSVVMQDYTTLSKTEAGKKILKAIVDRWNSIGLILGLQGEKQEEVALMDEQLTRYMLFDKESDWVDEHMAKILLPMGRRSLTALPVGVLNLAKFLEYIRKFDFEDEYRKTVERNKERGGYTDDEAETVALISDMVAEKVNNPSKSDEEIRSFALEKMIKEIEEARAQR